MTNLTILNTEIRTLDNLYSLNDLHKIAGKAKKHQPNLFLVNAQTQGLINEIDADSDQGIPRSVITKRGGNNQGTFACRELVYAYAMWISPKFHLQVIRAFDATQNQPNELIGNTEPFNNPVKPATAKDDIVISKSDYIDLLQHKIKQLQNDAPVLVSAPEINSTSTLKATNKATNKKRGSYGCAEIQVLIQLYQQNYTYTEIALKMNRTYYSVAAKIRDIHCGNYSSQITQALTRGNV